MNKFNELMEEATRLGSMVDTEWAEIHKNEYEEFDAIINESFNKREITAQQFNDLAMKAFYDYFDLKEVQDDEE